MCLDIAFYSALELIDNYFPNLEHKGEIEFDIDMGDHIMAMGHQRYPVVLYENGKYVREFLEWGIIAEYMNTPEKIKMQRKLMVNARAEKILDDKRSFWHRIRRARCLIPVNGIYEHRAIKGWKHKVPYYIKLKDRSLFCIAGLYHYNEMIPSDPETGEMIGMFTMITREGNDVLRQIHNDGNNAFRMPLFLPKELELKWLDPDLTDDEIRSILNYEMPSDQIQYWTVYSIRGRSERPDGKRKIEPFKFENLPPLGNDEASGKKQRELF